MSKKNNFERLLENLYEMKIMTYLELKKYIDAEHIKGRKLHEIALDFNSYVQRIYALTQQSKNKPDKLIPSDMLVYFAKNKK